MKKLSLNWNTLILVFGTKIKVVMLTFNHRHHIV
jgi:hypothetical protein